MPNDTKNECHSTPLLNDLLTPVAAYERTELDILLEKILDEELCAIGGSPVGAGNPFRDYNPFRNNPFNNTFNNAFPNAFPNIFRNK